MFSGIHSWRNVKKKSINLKSILFKCYGRRVIESHLSLNRSFLQIHFYPRHPNLDALTSNFEEMAPLRAQKNSSSFPFIWSVLCTRQFPLGISLPSQQRRIISAGLGRKCSNWHSARTSNPIDFLAGKNEGGR